MSLTLLSIFLAGYTALVVHFAKPLETTNRASASVVTETISETISE